MLTPSQYRQFAAIVHRNLTTPVPYHDQNFYRQQEAFSPHHAHPAFGCSYDWHSAVNSAWAAVRLWRVFPDDDAVRAAFATVQDRITPHTIATECEYLAANPHYEQPYGWAWLLTLYAEAPTQLQTILRPLAELIRDNLSRYFTDLIEPINHGVHSNTVFAAALTLDALAAMPELDAQPGSMAVVPGPLRTLIGERLSQWYLGKGSWPQQWERSGHDFLSPGLAVVEAMCAHLSPLDAAAFIDEFLPGWQSPLECYRVVYTNSRDAKQVHWHGLNLFRSGVLHRLAGHLESADAATTGYVRQQAQRLFDASVIEVTGDNYASTHWLPAFALRADKYAPTRR